MSQPRVWQALSVVLGGLVAATAACSSGGSGGRMPSSCAALPAPGTWEDVSTLPAPKGNLGWPDANDVTVHPNDGAIVYVGVNNGGIYKTTDCGATWAHVNTGRNRDRIDSGGPWSILIAPDTPDVMYAVIGYGSTNFWKSTNGGVDWDPLFDDGNTPPGAPTFFNGAAMDPADSRHLVVTPHADCAPPNHSGCLMETQDGGATWTVITAPFDGWAEGAGPVVIDRNTWLYATLFGGLWLTENRGATWRNVTPAGSGGAAPTLYRTTDGSYLLPSLNGVLRSADTRAWTLIEDSGGRTIGLTGDGKNLYTSDQWRRVYRTAPEVGGAAKWTDLTAAGLPQDDQGAPFLDLDRDHGILWSSNFAGGLWRLVVAP